MAKQKQATAHLMQALDKDQPQSSYITAMRESMSKLDAAEMHVQDIPLEQISANDNNFFTVDDVQDLVDSIDLLGIKQPLVVMANGDQIDGQQGYTLIAGHRRRKALLTLGKLTAPCVIMEAANNEFEELALIQTNTTSRSLSYTERMESVKRTEAALVALKEKGYDLPGAMRDRVAEITKEKATEVARMKVIDKNLSQPLREALTANKINASCAYALARLDDNGQAHFAEQIANGRANLVYAHDVDQYRERQDNKHWIPTLCPCPFNPADASPCSSYSQVLECRKNGREVTCCHDCLELHKGKGCQKACWRARSHVPPEKRAEELEREAEKEAKYLQAWRSLPGSKLPTRLHKILREREIDSKKLEDEIRDAHANDEIELPLWDLIPSEDNTDAEDMPTACNLAALCMALNISADYLLGLKDTVEMDNDWYSPHDAAPDDTEIVLVATADGRYRRARWGEDGSWYHPDSDDMPLDITVQYWTRNYPEGM